jgi:disulfide bond formation protein DsbB
VAMAITAVAFATTPEPMAFRAVSMALHVRAIATGSAHVKNRSCLHLSVAPGQRSCGMVVAMRPFRLWRDGTDQRAGLKT